MTAHAYQPGPWPTAVTSSAAVMVCGRAEPTLVATVFRALESGTPASEIAELTSTPLAIVTVTEAVADVIVRGTATVTVISESSTTTVSETSSPARIERPVGIELSNKPQGPGGRPSLPITSGVVLATSLTFVVTQSEPSDLVPEPEPEPQPDPEPVPEPEPDFDPFGMPPPEPETSSDPFGMPPPEPELEPELAPAPAAEERAVREVSVAQTAEWRTGMNVPAPEAGRGYDFVWEDTTAPPVVAPVTAQTPKPLQPDPKVEPAPFVDTPQSDHFGNTRMWTASSTATTPPPAVAPDGRSVLALVCAMNHSNPPHFATCRTCQAPLDAPARHISRPVVGTLRTSTGLQIPLDQTVIVGSRPDAKEVTEPQFTRFVTVPSPEREISRAHLAIRVDGWHVLAVDLQSTNGTYLLRGGRAPERIPASTPVLLTAGDSLDLGEGVLLHVEDVP